MKEAEALRTRMVSIFNRTGGDGEYTRLFTSLPASQRKSLLEAMPLKEAELPVVGSFQSPDNWMLITTKRVSWRTGERTQTLPLEGIHDVTADFNALRLSGHTKPQLQELQIETLNHEKVTLKTEEGSPLVGVWNMLKRLGNQNRSQNS